MGFLELWASLTDKSIISKTSSSSLKSSLIVHGWKCIRRRRRQREKEGKTREICRLVVIEDGDEQANDFFGDLFGRLQNELKIEVSSGRRCVFTCSLKKLMKRKRKIEFFGYFVAMCDRRRRMRRKMVVYSGKAHLLPLRDSTSTESPPELPPAGVSNKKNSISGKTKKQRKENCNALSSEESLPNSNGRALSS